MADHEYTEFPDLASISGHVARIRGAKYPGKFSLIPDSSQIVAIGRDVQIIVLQRLTLTGNRGISIAFTTV